MLTAASRRRLTKSGMVLKDIINELGRRLDCTLTNADIKARRTRSALTAFGLRPKDTQLS
jgi:hypothetical protein